MGKKVIVIGSSFPSDNNGWFERRKNNIYCRTLCEHTIHSNSHADDDFGGFRSFVPESGENPRDPKGDFEQTQNAHSGEQPDCAA